MKRECAILLIVTAGLMSAGCKSKNKAAAPLPPSPTATITTSATGVTVTNVTLGRMIDTDKKVTAVTDTFSPNDTIYASVDTQGAAPSASLSARWTFQDGQTVKEETQPIAPTGPATTEFHISKPDGWPAGTYKIEIMLDGTSIRTASFRVA